MKRVFVRNWHIVLAIAVLAWACAMATTQAQAAPPAPPPAASLTQVTAAITAQVGWSVQFGSREHVHPVVSSSRSPSWQVDSSGDLYLIFQSDCNLVLRSHSGGGAAWASNTVSGLRPCVLDFQLNGDIQIRNAASQLGWHTGVIHSGAVSAIFALYDSGCLIEYYWNAPTGRWVNQWRVTISDLHCEVYTA